MRHFNLGSCATEYDHVLDMRVGEEPVGVQRVAIWRLKCGAPYGPCATQYGPELHPKVVRKLEELLADFTPRSNAAVEVSVYFTTTDTLAQRVDTRAIKTRDRIDSPEVWSTSLQRCSGASRLPILSLRISRSIGVSEGKHTTSSTQFQPGNNPFFYTANKFLHAVKEADDALAILYLMDDAPELPKEAVYRLRTKLNRARKWLEDMPTSILPLPPKKEKATNPGETNHISGEPSSDEEDSEAEGGQFLGSLLNNSTDRIIAEEDPEWDDIEIIEPRNWEAGNDEHLIHVIIYAEHNKAPFHARFRVAAGKSLDISTYPIEWSTATFIAFSVLKKEYERVKGPINMEGRGNVMVYRKYGVHPGSCPRSGKWERLAMQAVEKEIIRGGLSELPPSSPPWPSSSTQVSMARSATPALVAGSIKSKGKGPLDILEDGLTEQGDKLAAAAPMAAALSSGLLSTPVGPAAPVASCSIAKRNGKRPAEAALAGPAAKKANRGSSAAYPIYLE
ncbi:hypothetical protein DFH09DRAFT_1104195 [Mycena vulgaris]|nr:hypothetical protein DFH09DRAFT_1104195 [Mycena vulgaris]